VRKATAVLLGVGLALGQVAAASANDGSWASVAWGWVLGWLGW